jgi:hypothetical protein
MTVNIAKLGLFVAPVVAISVGVWAEFAELTAPVLFVVALPAMIVSTACAAMVWRRVPVVVALAAAGAAFGALTFGLSEGTNVVLALARGSDLDFGDYQSRAAIASLLVGVHLVAGAMVGAGVGLGLAVLYGANAWVVRRATGLTPSPFPKGKGNPPAVQ